MQTWTQRRKEISKDPWEAEEERQSKGQRFMDINIAEEKEIGKKWCKEGKKTPTLKSMQIYTGMQLENARWTQKLCALLFISVIVLLPISTLRLVVKSLGAPHREYNTQIKPPQWRKRGWRKDKRKNRILLLQQACVPVWFYLLGDMLLEFISVYQNGEVHTCATMTTAHKYNHLHSKTLRDWWRHKVLYKVSRMEPLDHQYEVNHCIFGKILEGHSRLLGTAEPFFDMSKENKQTEKEKKKACSNTKLSLLFKLGNILTFLVLSL